MQGGARIILYKDTNEWNYTLYIGVQGNWDINILLKNFLQSQVYIATTKNFLIREIRKNNDGVELCDDSDSTIERLVYTKCTGHTEHSRVAT